MALSCRRNVWLKNARQAELNQAYDDEPDEEAELEQDELARQFAATQQQRYGEATLRKKRMRIRS
jgi:hypothetical protein